MLRCASGLQGDGSARPVSTADYSPFIIAEAGVNHNGDVMRAIEMVEVAADCGADCIKFQAFDPESLVAVGTQSAAYQNRNTGKPDQLDLLRSLSLSQADFARIAECCHNRGIEFLATPFDLDMLETLVALGMRRVKVASGELINYAALERFAKTGLPIILSTGMATDGEVDAAIAFLRSANATQITVLQCTSIYPAPISQANLRAMVAMGKRNDVPFGYSDHTLGEHAALAATALGASVLEKHFTLNRSLPGPDHKASLEPIELAQMINHAREISVALGSDRKVPSEEELKTAALVRRSWHSTRQLKAGTIIAFDDAVLKRPATGIAATQSIIGRQLISDVGANEPIRAADLAAQQESTVA